MRAVACRTASASVYDPGEYQAGHDDREGNAVIAEQRQAMLLEVRNKPLHSNNGGNQCDEEPGGE